MDPHFLKPRFANRGQVSSRGPWMFHALLPLLALFRMSKCLGQLDIRNPHVASVDSLEPLAQGLPRAMGGLAGSMQAVVETVSEQVARLDSGFQVIEHQMDPGYASRLPADQAVPERRRLLQEEGGQSKAHGVAFEEPEKKTSKVRGPLKAEGPWRAQGPLLEQVVRSGELVPLDLGYYPQAGDMGEGQRNVPLLRCRATECPTFQSCQDDIASTSFDTTSTETTSIKSTSVEATSIDLELDSRVRRGRSVRNESGEDAERSSIRGRIPKEEWGADAEERSIRRGRKLQELSTVIQACSVKAFRDSDSGAEAEEEVVGLDEEAGPACPVVGDQSGGKLFLPKCQMAAGDWARAKWLGQVFLLSDVYVTGRGDVFSATHLFYPGGCIQNPLLHPSFQHWLDVDVGRLAYPL